MLLAGERKSRGLHLWPGLMAMEFRGWVGGLGLLLTVSQELGRTRHACSFLYSLRCGQFV